MKRGIFLLTYSLSAESSSPFYEQLVSFLRADILSERIPAGSRLPSKRSFAGNLGVSTITVENAYNRLIDEGFVRSEPRRGYFVTELARRSEAFPFSSEYTGLSSLTLSESSISLPETRTPVSLDLSGNRTPADRFPFSVWTHLLRETVNEKGSDLLIPSPCGGVRPLRESIASHLNSFRGMQVDPDQVVIGAGTEYLYGQLIQLLGRDRVFCLEDPGYQKISQIYTAQGVDCHWIPMDESGLTVSGLESVGVDVVHISPTHHFPTGITMPAPRRYELLSWATAKPNRYIIEDDYDSEFRLTGRPLPSLQSIDKAGCVVYMNTFSRTLASTIRISYMVLPPVLANEYYRRLSFYSCTVSNFEQYTLARFISDGFFEKHLNRMRLYYTRLRRRLLEEIAASPAADRLTVLERDSGLHFLLHIKTECPDVFIHEMLRSKGVNLLPLSIYYRIPEAAPPHTFILTYSSLRVEELRQALQIISEMIGDQSI